MVLRDRADAPPIAPPRYSLLAVAPTADDAQLRWQGGYQFVSELGSAAHGSSALEECYAWADNPALTTNTDTGALVLVDPVTLWAGDVCSTLGSGVRDWMGRARRLLAAHQSADLAAYVWAAQLAVASPELTVATPGGATDPAEALACLEAELHATLWGPVGYVHTSPAVLTLLVAARAVERDGTRWVTPMGTVVIADAGYPGTAPAGSAAGTGWMIGTGPVRVRLGPVEVLPNTDQADQNLDVLANTRVVLAWRAAAVELDLAAHVAARVVLSC